MKKILVLLFLLIATSAHARYISVDFTASAGAEYYTFYWGTATGVYDYSVDLLPDDGTAALWLTGTEYTDGDHAYYNNNIWVANQTTTGNTPSDSSSYWDGPYIAYLTATSTTEPILIEDETVYTAITATNSSAEESAESDEIIFYYLVQDGYPTPEQISVYLGEDAAQWSATATATMRFREAGEVAWITGHDLYHIPAAEFEPGFAWTIFDLDMGTNYAVEVTVSDGGEDDIIYTTLMSTASLPAENTGEATINIDNSMTPAQINSAIQAASAGDIIEFANGTYDITGGDLTFNDSGTADNWIYVRGESRDGVILHDVTEGVLYINGSQYVVFEDMTLLGAETDAWPNSETYSTGITLRGDYSSNPMKGHLVFRRLNIQGVDHGITSRSKMREVFIYECYLEGNNTWTQDIWYQETDQEAPDWKDFYQISDGLPDIHTSAMWGDEGIKITGVGIAVWNNTLTGFGDTLNAKSLSVGGESYVQHFYRNKILMSGDDTFEFDHSRRNISFYDNHSTNTMMGISVQPVHAGPIFAFRNIFINIGKKVWKLNYYGSGINNGWFIYNNTVVNTEPNDDDYWLWNWIQAGGDGTKQEYFGFQNNIMIYENPKDGAGNLENNSYTPTYGDWSYNSYYPDGQLRWSYGEAYYDDLADAQSSPPQITPMYSGITTGYYEDIISEVQPFDVDIVFGANTDTEVTTFYTPTLTASGVSDDTGIAIVGITDGYDGAAPDRGAIISGRTNPTYGATYVYGGGDPDPYPIGGGSGKFLFTRP